MPDEPLTPVQVENRIVELNKARTAALRQLQEAADALVDAQEDVVMAKAEYDFAKDDATTSPDCPIVGRGPGEVTCAYRDSWVGKRIRRQREKLIGAQSLVRRRRAVVEAARRHLDDISEQTMSAQSLLKSVNEAYRGTGGGPR